MKKLLMVMLVVVLASFFFVGCDSPVPDPIPDPDPIETPIVCEGGHYVIHYKEWQDLLCDDSPTYPAGLFWENSDGRLFMLGEKMDISEVLDLYGACPDDYIEEII